MTNPFLVHASNIHTGESETYGPFAGPPQLSYELLRANEDEGPPYEIFGWYDPPQPDTLSPDGEPIGVDPDDDHWTDQEGDDRYDGWRHLVRRPVPADPAVSYTEPEGPFWTDLFLCSDPEHLTAHAAGQEPAP